MAACAITNAPLGQWLSESFLQPRSESTYPARVQAAAKKALALLSGGLESFRAQNKSPDWRRVSPDNAPLRVEAAAILDRDEGIVHFSVRLANLSDRPVSAQSLRLMRPAPTSVVENLPLEAPSVGPGELHILKGEMLNQFQSLLLGISSHFLFFPHSFVHFDELCHVVRAAGFCHLHWASPL